MTLYDLLEKSGMLDVFHADASIRAYAKSTFIHVNLASIDERVPIEAIQRTGDHMTIVVDI